MAVTILVRVGLKFIENWKSGLEAQVCRYEQTPAEKGQIVFYGPSNFACWSEKYGMKPLTRKRRETMKGRFPKKPVIRKLGTIGANNIVETTPIVFHGELYRFEVVRRRSFASGNTGVHWSMLNDSPCLRFVHVRSGASTPLFAEDHTFGFPFVVDGRMYVVSCAGREWGSDTLHFFRSDDLKNWELYAQWKLPGWKIYNMNVACKDGSYTLLLEISDPPEECGPHNFTFRFARSQDLSHWELTPWECAFQRDRYAGSPALYTLAGDPYCYVCYLEAYPGPCYANCIARSKDLISWEYSPVNGGERWSRLIMLL